MNQPYDVSALEAATTSLAIALGHWEGRDDTRPQPEVRRAANEAMDAIDAMIRELYAMRSRLVTEIRASDDATGRRVDELLGRSRQAAAQVTEVSDGCPDHRPTLDSENGWYCAACGSDAPPL